MDTSAFHNKVFVTFLMNFDGCMLLGFIMGKTLNLNPALEVGYNRAMCSGCELSRSAQDFPPGSYDMSAMPKAPEDLRGLGFKLRSRSGSGYLPTRNMSVCTYRSEEVPFPLNHCRRIRDKEDVPGSGDLIRKWFKKVKRALPWNLIEHEMLLSCLSTAVSVSSPCPCSCWRFS